MNRERWILGGEAAFMLAGLVWTISSGLARYAIGATVVVVLERVVIDAVMAIRRRRAADDPAQPRSLEDLPDGSERLDDGQS